MISGLFDPIYFNEIPPAIGINLLSFYGPAVYPAGAFGRLIIYYTFLEKNNLS